MVAEPASEQAQVLAVVSLVFANHNAVAVGPLVLVAWVLVWRLPALLLVVEACGLYNRVPTFTIIATRVLVTSINVDVLVEAASIESPRIYISSLEESKFRGSKELYQMTRPVLS